MLIRFQRPPAGFLAGTCSCSGYVQSVSLSAICVIYLRQSLHEAIMLTRHLAPAPAPAPVRRRRQLAEDLSKSSSFILHQQSIATHVSKQAAAWTATLWISATPPYIIGDAGRFVSGHSRTLDTPVWILTADSTVSHLFDTANKLHGLYRGVGSLRNAPGSRYHRQDCFQATRWIV